MENLTGMVRKSGKYYFAFGGAADVWKGEWTQPTEHSTRAMVLAIKTIRSAWDDPQYLKTLNRKLIREGTVWSSLDHPNITPFYGVSFDLDRPAAPSLICPYYRNRDAPSYLSRHPEANRLELVSQVVAGLAYLHRFLPKAIVHGDIKGSNILINDKLEASITDFGLSRVLETSGFTTASTAGTCRWMAYELMAINDDDEDDDVNPPPATTATDIWAFGMIVIELLTGRLPFHHLRHDSAVILFIMKQGRPLRSNSPEITDDIWSVLERCWTEDPKSRPSMASLALFFDVTNALASSHRRLADSEIAQLLASPTPLTSPNPGRNGLLGRFHSLKRLGGTTDRQRRNDRKDILRRRFSLPERASKKCFDIDTGQPVFHYYCNWPECPEGFDTLAQCQAHEMGHRRWALVPV